MAIRLYPFVDGAQLGLFYQTAAGLASDLGITGGTGGGSSTGSNGTVQVADGNGGFAASSIIDDGSAVAITNGESLQLDFGAGIQFNGSDSAGFKMGMFNTVNTHMVGKANSIQIITDTGNKGPDGIAIGNSINQSLFEINGFGSAILGNPSGGGQGLGSLNAENGVYDNGVRLSGLPAGGSPGQPVINSAPGEGTWGNAIQAALDHNLSITGGSFDSIANGSVSVLGGSTPTSGVNGGAVSVSGGPSVDGASGNAALQGGDGASGDASGGDSMVRGGQPTGAGTPGSVYIQGASAASGGGQNGGNVTIRLGDKDGAGRFGRFYLNNVTSAPGSGAGTLTNAPVAGNPTKWIELVVDNQIGYVPWWPAP